MGEDAWDEADEARCQCTPLLPAKGNDLPHQGNRPSPKQENEKRPKTIFMRRSAARKNGRTMLQRT